LVYGLITGITCAFVLGAVLWDDKQTVPTETIDYESPRLWIIFPIVNNNGIIYLLWDYINNATGYEVYRSMDEGKCVCIANVHPTKNYTLIYKDVILESGKYDYKLKAIYQAGISGFSNIRRVYVNL